MLSHRCVLCQWLSTAWWFVVQFVEGYLVTALRAEGFALLQDVQGGGGDSLEPPSGGEDEIPAKRLHLSLPLRSSRSPAAQSVWVTLLKFTSFQRYTSSLVLLGNRSLRSWSFEALSDFCLTMLMPLAPSVRWRWRVGVKFGLLYTLGWRRFWRSSGTLHPSSVWTSWRAWPSSCAWRPSAPSQTLLKTPLTRLELYDHQHQHHYHHHH